MKKLFTYLFLLLNTSAMGQNLVPNPSFEIFTNCPQFLNQLNFATGWSSYRETADYFNSCANLSQPALGVPNNELGNQYAKEGSAYIRLINYVKTLPNAQEHAGIQLLQPLIVGQQYFVSFWVSRCDTTIEDCAVNKIGAKFSTIAYSTSSPDSLNNFAHIYTDSIITDKVNWIKISGTFTADSAYSYLIIGNFFDDGHIDTAECSGLSTLASYFFDGICVSVDSLECVNAFTSVHETVDIEHFNVLSNPLLNTLTIISSFNQYLLNLFDTSGRLLLKKQIKNSKAQISTDDFEEGIYLLQIIHDKQFFLKKILIQH